MEKIVKYAYVSLCHGFPVKEHALNPKANGGANVYYFDTKEEAEKCYDPYMLGDGQDVFPITENEWNKIAKELN